MYRLGPFRFEARMIERASPFSFGLELQIQTCYAGDLIVLKLFGGRALDLRYAEGVHRRSGSAFPAGQT